MASEAQIQANRRNAQRSTGPKSEQGKASVAQNALIHGLRAEKVLGREEDPAAFAALREELRERWEPEGEIEAALLERMTLFLWRMRRAAEMEGRAFEAMTAGNDATNAAVQLGLLTRYEAAIERGYARCADLLARAQARRGLITTTPQQQTRDWIDWMMHAPVPGQRSDEELDELDEDDRADDAEV